MRRPNRSLVAFTIAVVALAAFLPGIALLDCAWLEPAWVLLVDETPVAAPPLAPDPAERPAFLLSLLPSRAPPSIPVA